MSSVPSVRALPPEPKVQYNYQPSSPHLEEPLAAPRPHKLTPDLPAEVGSTMFLLPSFYLEHPDGAHPRQSSIPRDSSAR